MKKLQILPDNIVFLSVIKNLLTRTSVLAVLLACVCGCEPDIGANEPPPAVASKQEVAGLEKALADDAAKRSLLDAADATNIVDKAESATNAVAKQVKADDDANAGKESGSGKEKMSSKLPPPTVTRFTHDYGVFRLQFSDDLDEALLIRYVNVSPYPGPLTKGYYYDWERVCTIRGNFKPRTKYTLTVRAGLPFKNGRVLERDFVRTWTTGDEPKKIEFASSGRYLPAAVGRRSVAIRTMNVTNLFCQISMMPPRNIVQMLAREDGKYGSYYGGGGDSYNAQEIAGEPVSHPIRVNHRLNEMCETPLVVRNDDGEVAKGVYLISAYDGDNENVRSWEKAWKLVCVTDIGLSVREANGSVYVWATSLTTGKPIKGLRVLVYGSNNVEMGEGVTDADGWCACEMPEAGKPFAIVASCMDGSDTSFLSLNTVLDETATIGARRNFLFADATEAFVWSERGIYRHNETIFVHALVRNGKGNAPRPMPLTVALIDPEGKVFKKSTQVTDVYGAISCANFTVPDDQPSGRWTLVVQTPGDDPFELGRRTVKIEEFVPPQIRVNVAEQTDTKATNGAVFTVSGEFLFGGPTKGLRAECAMMFADEPFVPRGWEAFRFGDCTRRIKPNFKTLDKVDTNDKGCASFFVEFPKNTFPRAAVKLMVQGSIFEAGGRPATARTSSIIHTYPYYIGVALPDVLRESSDSQSCRVVIVNPDGTPHRGERTLIARFEQIDRVYSLKKTNDGFWKWRSDEVRTPMGDDVNVSVSADGVAMLKIPTHLVGDYSVRLFEKETNVSFGAVYCVNGKDDPIVRAPLENPSKVTLTADKKVYYAGDRPKITVKSPFPGYAWLNILRDELVYSQVFALTNATSEIVLEPVKADWTPSLDVAISVVQAARVAQRAGVMNRAFGLLPIRVATHDSELDVKVKANVVCAPTGGAQVTVDVDTKNKFASGDRAVVTLTDEGIHILTDEKVPDPISWFGETRESMAHLWDIYNQLLPILDDKFKHAGAKTGGGGEGDLFRRMSPIPTRRFKPLSVWKKDVVLKDGRATVPFTLPEFVGEVRVTAIAYNKRATGAGAVQTKVAPNLVMQPDAPRFAAPGDTFLATVTFSNRSGGKGKFTYDLMAGGAVTLSRPVHGELTLADGASETLTFPVSAGATPGEGSLIFVSEGMGEKHTNEIKLPVRPAAPWSKTVETVCIKPGAGVTFANTAAYMPDAACRTFIAAANPIAELASALEYLIAYPYGCLEQTTARVFPLVTSGGILNTLPVNETSAADASKGMVDAGIRRVCSMVRANDFVMWPDGNIPPWDRSVSLWAAHFLVEAQKNGFSVPQDRLSRVKGFLRTWAMSTNETTSVYALHTLALAGTADRDRMLLWFDKREALTSLDRARLARAFRSSGDPERARELLNGVHPANLKEASFALLAALELDPADARVLQLVTKILDMRDGSSRHWQTTDGNAHALLALGAYYRTVPPTKGKPELSISVNGNTERLSVKKAKSITGCGDVVVTNSGDGDAYVSASTLALTDPADVKTEANGIKIERQYLSASADKVDISKLTRGEMIVVVVKISAPAETTYSDLVLEELLPACFEADVTPNSGFEIPAADNNDWAFRREMRDDRVLAFSKRFTLRKGDVASFDYVVRVVSAGEFVVPGPYIEAMYDPGIRARGEATRIKIVK